MYRINTSTAAPGGLFTEGDPSGSIPATVVSAAWFNDVQEELIAILAAAGIAPAQATQTQVLAALRLLFADIGGSAGQRFKAAAAQAGDEAVTRDQGDGRFAALAGLATQKFKIAAGVAADEAVRVDQLATKAAKNGDAAQLFAVANPVANADAANKGWVEGQLGRTEFFANPLPAANVWILAEKTTLGTVCFSTGGNYLYLAVHLADAADGLNSRVIGFFHNLHPGTGSIPVFVVAGRYYKFVPVATTITIFSGIYLG
jgi:hypothetical protein